MSTTASIQIADAIADAINSHTFSRTISAERGYVPEYVGGDGSDPVVWVIPAERAMSRETRGQWAEDVTIHVGLFAWLGDREIDTIDSLMVLAEEIVSFLRDTTIDSVGLQSVECMYLFDQENIKNKKTFVSVYAFKYSTR